MAMHLITTEKIEKGCLGTQTVKAQEKQGMFGPLELPPYGNLRKPARADMQINHFVVISI